MTLPPGTRLGPYEVVSAIGAGGMGEVYRARDTRLARDVAVKVLPPDASANHDRRQRFQREAQAVAALSHPNICAIYDVGSERPHPEHEPIDFLVLEFLEGESLADRLGRGRLLLVQALSIASEIAAALSAAHRRSIVHRDLKPGNIMLTKTGVKILDFGLARIIHGDRDAPAASAATFTAPLTSAGTVLGTLPYMAPEQIEGLPADARTDVFAFGTTLYEMLTGKRAFDAGSGPGLIGAILRGETPSITATDPSLAPSLDRLVRTCLEKDPDKRFESMHDVGLELARITADRTSAVAVSPNSDVDRGARRWAYAAGLLAIVVAVAAGAYVLGRRTSPPVQPASAIVFDIELPEGTVPYAGVALSPQGTTLAVSARSNQPGGVVSLWVRELAAMIWRRVEGTGGATYPFWSPDGTRLAFFTTEGKLKQLAYPNGEPITVCAVNEGRGGVWLDDGSILFAPFTGGLMRVRAEGGVPAELVPLREGDATIRFPARVDATHVMYLVPRNNKAAELRMFDVGDPGRQITVVESRNHGAVDSGTLFYSRDDTLIGQRIDARTGQLSGDPVRVPFDALSPTGNLGYGQFSAAGGHLAVANVRSGLRQLVWRDRSGGRLATLGEPENQQTPELSRDGRSVAVARTPASQARPGIWIGDVQSGAFRNRTSSEGFNGTPIWSADGSRLAFQSSAGATGNNNVHVVSADGPLDSRPLVEIPLSNLLPVGWVADSDVFVWRNLAAPSLAAGLYSGPAAHPVLFRAEAFGDARLSPDGHFIAWSSIRSGQNEVYVDTFPKSGTAPARVSRGGRMPRWRGDSRELYYIAPDNRLMAVNIGPNGPDAPRVLFEVPAGAAYAVAGKADRFLLLEQTTESVNTVKVTLNWPAFARRTP